MSNPTKIVKVVMEVECPELWNGDDVVNHVYSNLKLEARASVKYQIWEHEINNLTTGKKMLTYESYKNYLNENLSFIDSVRFISIDGV